MKENHNFYYNYVLLAFYRCSCEDTCTSVCIDIARHKQITCTVHYMWYIQ